MVVEQPKATDVIVVTTDDLEEHVADGVSTITLTTVETEPSDNVVKPDEVTVVGLQSVAGIVTVTVDFGVLDGAGELDGTSEHVEPGVSTMTLTTVETEPLDNVVKPDVVTVVEAQSVAGTVTVMDDNAVHDEAG